MFGGARRREREVVAHQKRVALLGRYPARERCDNTTFKFQLQSYSSLQKRVITNEWNCAKEGR